LAPAFAITAHASQGQTLAAAIVDLQLGRGVSIIASYVSFTRVLCMMDLLIFRAFDRSLFSKGAALGPELLLRVLRGEAVGWRAMEEKYTPRRRCAGCEELRFKDEFNARQFQREGPWCKACFLTKREAGTGYQCGGCNGWKSRGDFAER
jgi:hypothetical protein